MIKRAKKRHNALNKEMIKTLEKWDDLRLARSRRDVNEDEEDRMNKREAAIKNSEKKRRYNLAQELADVGNRAQRQEEKEADDKIPRKTSLGSKTLSRRRQRYGAERT